MKGLGSALAAAAVLVCTAASSAAGPPSRIVFAAAPVTTAWGEIYRINPNGTRVDLSRSPAADLFPAVSPDGKRVAFVSVRGGAARVYLVGSDGSGLRAVSPAFPLARGDAVEASLAWSPNARRLAVELSTGSRGFVLYVTGTSSGWHRVSGNVTGVEPVWSPDGSRFAYSLETGLVVVARPDGARLWRTAGNTALAWSRTGRLGVQQSTEVIDVYTAGGTHLSRLTGESFAWSPDGRVLASMENGVLSLRTGGGGAPTLRAHVGGGEGPVQWLSRTRLRVLGDRDGIWHGYDRLQRRTFALPAPLRAYLGVVSAHGTGAYPAFDRMTVTLRLGPRAVATAPSCSDDQPFASLQFVGRTNALVYQSGCPVPSADLEAVAPDGSNLQQLTKTPQHEFDPALSADGTRIAYTSQPVADRCKGCAEALSVTAPARQLTSPKDADEEPFDAHPSWSPDGSTIVFDRSGASTVPHLMTIPAAGGPPSDLEIPATHPAWGPKLIAYVAVRASVGVQTYDPATRAVKTVAPGVDPTSLAWSQDGRLAYLVAGPNDGAVTIRIVGSSTRIDLSKLLPRAASVAGLAWSPDGTRFAFAATDADGIGDIYTIGVDGIGLTRVTHDVGALTFFSALSWR